MLNKETHTLRIQNINLLIKFRRRHSEHFQSNNHLFFFSWNDKAIKVKVLSLVQQSQEGSVSTLDRRSFQNIGDNMVLQSFDLNGSCGGIDHLPPYIGDYAPSTAAFYTDLDSTPYSQGKLPNLFSTHQIFCLIIINKIMNVMIKHTHIPLLTGSYFFVFFSVNVQLFVKLCEIQETKSRLIKRNCFSHQFS